MWQTMSEGNPAGSFLTLSYDDDRLDGPLTVAKVQDDLKNLLKKLREKYRRRNVPFRYLWCIERGTRFGRLHIHMLIFGLPAPAHFADWRRHKFNEQKGYHHWDQWDYGQTKWVRLEPASIHYVTDYVGKGEQHGFTRGATSHRLGFELIFSCLVDELKRHVLFCEKRGVQPSEILMERPTLWSDGQSRFAIPDAIRKRFNEVAFQLGVNFHENLYEGPPPEIDVERRNLENLMAQQRLKLLRADLKSGKLDWRDILR